MRYGTDNHVGRITRQNPLYHQRFSALVAHSHCPRPSRLSRSAIFRRSSFGGHRTWVTVAAITSAIFAGCRYVSLVIAEIRTYRLSLKARRTFHLTPTTRDCHWGSTRQQDGTITTHIAVSLMAKNLSDRMLHLLTARLIKPKISGEILANFLLIEDRQTSEYGSVQMTGKHIPPDAIRALAITIIVRGVPKQKAGKLRPLAAVLSIADAEGNEQRVKVDLRPFDPNAMALHTSKAEAYRRITQKR